MQANYANALCHLNATPLNKVKMGQCLGGGLLALGFSLSLFLSLLALFTRLWAKFKGLFYSFCRSFISFHCKFFLFYRSFNSSFYLQKAFFRALCFFEIFKCFVFGLLRPFCHFEPLQKGDPTGCKAQAAAKKSTKIKRKLTILGYFANAQYDKFGLLFKKNGYFHSNFRDKIYKFYSFLWIATLALLARNDGKAKIQIFHSKFKAFHKFNSFCKFKAFYKFNSFYKFISKFKPYTRLFYIFTPNFRAVFTDKFSRKEELWQQLAQKAGQEQSRRLKATENAVKPTK